MEQIKGKQTFFCPYCGQKLSFLNGEIIKLVGRLHAEGFSCKTMFYIPSALGKYGCIVGEGVRIKKGTKVEFECINGACKHNFTASYDDNLAEIKMKDADNQEYVVVFNKIFGVKSTFLIDFKKKEIVETYGEDSGEYIHDFDGDVNFFGY